MNKEESVSNLNQDETSNASTSTSASSTSNEETDEQQRKLQYLLKQTEIFAHFVTNATKPKSPKKSSKKKKKNQPNQRHRKTEKEEDEELLESTKHGTVLFTFEESPKYIKNGEMRDYQIRGLNWMITLYENNINGILADEMGLGKTLQTISILGYLKHFRKIDGHHLVVVPKTTIQNWLNEFQKWCPSIKVISLIGYKDDRKQQIANTVRKNDWNVLVTSYEMILLETYIFKQYNWKYLVVDEAQRMKNECSKLAIVLRRIKAKNRLLLTGTPLQNNLHELWSLLNFLLPDVFNSSDDFDSWFNTNNFNDNSIVKRLHSILKPFLLRRIKSEVEKSLLPKKMLNIYCGLTKMQREWYTKILTKDISIVNGYGQVQKTRLQYILMHLRKCTNHPYLFDGAEPGPPYTTDEHLVKNSGKMIVLDKLLPKLKSQGSRVLIFSQMVRMMDILEDYFIWRNYEYCRIDGNTSHIDRSKQIDEFNEDNSKKFIFILSTRAGGLGINLATADYVIIYDSDWNPQVDLQAMDRAHRIGQKKQVHVLRLIIENTVDEKIIERAEMKLRLDKIVIQQGCVIDRQTNQLNKDDLLKMIQHGANKIFATKEDDEILEKDIDEILKIADQKTQEQQEQLNKLGESSLKNLSLDAPSSSLYDFEGENYRNKQKQIADNWIEPPKRDRKVTSYVVDKMFPSNQNADIRPKPKSKQIRPPKQPIIYDYQFYPRRLHELLDQEMNFYRKTTNFNYPLDMNDIGQEIRDEWTKKQEKIDNAIALTTEEEAEKNELSEQGFSTWTKRDYLKFVKLIEKYGPNNMETISQGIEGKTPEEVIEYRRVFLERCDELQDAKRIQVSIKRMAEQKEKELHVKKILNAKINNCRSPFYELKVCYYGNKGRYFTEEDDRFMLCTLNSIGVDKDNAYDELLRATQTSPQLRFNWFLKSRTSHQLQRRCTLLFSNFEREYEETKVKTNSDEQKKTTVDTLNAGILKNVNQENTSKRKADSDFTISNNTSVKKLKTNEFTY